MKINKTHLSLCGINKNLDGEYYLTINKREILLNTNNLEGYKIETFEDLADTLFRAGQNDIQEQLKKVLNIDSSSDEFPY